MNDAQFQSQLQSIARHLEAQRRARPAVGHLNGAGHAARARPHHGNARDLDGGEVRFADPDLEAVCAEPALRWPEPDDPDFSELNGHAGNGVGFYRNGHAFDPVQDAVEVRQRSPQGRGPVAARQGGGMADTYRPARSVGAMGIWQFDSALAGPDVAYVSWLRKALDVIAPTPFSRLLWLIAIVGIALRLAGAI